MERVPWSRPRRRFPGRGWKPGPGTGRRPQLRGKAVAERCPSEPIAGVTLSQSRHGSAERCEWRARAGSPVCFHK
ncbi:unnamed protein product [Caretta caretta]